MVIDICSTCQSIFRITRWFGGDYSIEIEDYVKLGLAQQFGTSQENDL